MLRCLKDNDRSQPDIDDFKLNWNQIEAKRRCRDILLSGVTLEQLP